ncbi:Uncharacterised protein [Salmonella enterica subsp. enterica serovar Bovismorbificans]|nr:Uncharacterised protein [Salmonella enterica subsp. enterica serovar Bovismorbificans]CNU81483.1 Uncharacterised protein [Salmonella enterica subsp. enterica serovar Bovismorbificans]CPR80244.1 Uncharacterised protein [Salmonella enterica subsp. enterica serovar Bovismorbificans]
MQRQRQLPVHRHFVHWRLLRRIDHALRHAVLQRLLNDSRIVWIEEHVQLTLVQIFFVFRTGSAFNGIGVIQQYAKITDTANTGFRANSRLTGFDTRVAEDALLGLAALPVEVNLLVRAAGDAHPPAAALVLVDQHDAIFFTLVDSTARAGRHARRVKAVLAQARQVHHEGVFELAVHRLLHVFEVLVFGAFFEFATQNLFPVWPAGNFVHPLAGNQRARTRDRLMFAFRRGVQILIVEIKRLVVVIHTR